MQRRISFTFIRNQYQARVTYELHIYILKSLRDLLILAIAFFIDNTAVQIVATVNHTHIPLRDIGYEVLLAIDSNGVTCIGIPYSAEMIAIIWVLFCFLNGSKGLTVIQKSARCLAIARTLRVCLFSMLILPSPKEKCRFTGPIRPFVATFGGGCNDLLYSGHVTIYTLIGISFTILSREYSSKILRYGLPICIWLHMSQRIICTILERHHYSIDMFLGFIVVLLIWQCKPLHLDLPKVPQNLYLHLRQLFFPRSISICKEV